MLKVFLVEDETLIREGLRDRIPWEQYGLGSWERQEMVRWHCHLSEKRVRM